MSREELDANIIARLLESRGTTRVRVAPYFPVGMAERLGVLGVETLVAHDLTERRRAKRDDAVAALERVQHATEDAWAHGVDAIRRATVRMDGTLELDREVFTAERLRAIVEGRLLELGCSSEGAIVAPGRQAADPHMIGTGPLCARQPIVMDI